MKRWDAVMTVLMLGCIIFTCSLFIGEVVGQTRWKKDNERKLQVLHWVFPIARGEVKSPAVIIDLETEREFGDKFRELNASVVYLDFRYSAIKRGWLPELYVFNEDYSLAWRWTLEPILEKSKYIQGD